MTIPTERLRVLRNIVINTEPLVFGPESQELCALIDAELSHRENREGNLELWHRFGKGSVHGYAIDYDGFCALVAHLQRLRGMTSAEAGVFGRADLPQVMVYTAKLCKNFSHEMKIGYEQVVLFADHQRALDALLQGSECKSGERKAVVEGKPYKRSQRCPHGVHHDNRCKECD
jgi:hypothetical protein